MQGCERPNQTNQTEPDHAGRCKILAKKGFLSARNLTTGIALLLYSREFQLGVLFHLPLGSESPVLDSDDQVFAHSAMAMILREFQALGVRKQDLITYAVGGSSRDGESAAIKTMVRRTLWNHELTLCASDLGGQQMRSIWLDVENGRTIVRSERIQLAVSQSTSQFCAAS